MKFYKGQIPWNKGKTCPQLSLDKHHGFRNLQNINFGSLNVIKLAGSNKYSGCLWLCKCKCGNEKVIASQSLIKGLTKSCGCQRGESIARKKFKHGKVKTSTYYSWGGMISRCYNSKEDSYKFYGAKGIKVCRRWRKDFRNFLADMGESKKGLSLDRINSKGNYEPGNCRWITKSENSRKAMLERYHANY